MTLQERLRDLEWHEHSADEQRSRRYEAAAALVALNAERDRLKARWFADDDPKETEYAEEFEAYRREFQKEEA